MPDIASIGKIIENDVQLVYEVISGNVKTLLYNLQVRDPAKITTENENLVVTKCNIFDKEDLKPHVEKADVVMSCLGFALAWSEPVP